jgi:hypothetical protein
MRAVVGPDGDRVAGRQPRQRAGHVAHRRAEGDRRREPDRVAHGDAR